MTDDLLRTVLERLRPDELAGVASATSALRTAIEASPAPVSDRHAVSTPTPRSATTLRNDTQATRRD